MESPVPQPSGVRLASAVLRGTRSSTFFFNDTATTEIYTLSLHDALPISIGGALHAGGVTTLTVQITNRGPGTAYRDRKSTRLNSSHVRISYAVFCLKKKTQSKRTSPTKKKKTHDQ